MTLRRMFLYGYLAVLIMGVGASAFFTWRAVERHYLTTQRENLLALARQSADAFRGPSIPTDIHLEYSQMSNAAPGIHSRLLTDQGGVVFNYPPTSDQITPPAAENALTVSSADLLARPEIQSALAGEPSTTIRAVSGRKVLYAAAPVLDLADQPIGLVYLAMPIPNGGIPTDLAWQLIGITAAAILLMAGVGGLLFRRILTPIENLVQASEAVGHGDLHRKVLAQSGLIELDSLAGSFNQMTENLQRSEQTRNAFLADVNHELRTPLTVIHGTIETLQDGAMDDLHGRDALLAGMSHETDRLIRMVNDLLLLTRADSGELRLNKEIYNLAQLLTERVDFFKPLAEKKSIRLNLLLPNGHHPCNLNMDRDRIAQVVDNLLANAIQYSPTGAEIRISLLVQGGRFVCSVQDSGPGVPAAAIERVFDRFYRVDPSRGRQSGGAGLGLAITRALVRAHGGEITCTSIPNQETIFQFWLPVELPRP